MTDYIGHLDSFENGLVTGWAAFPADYDIRPEIKFYIDDSLIGSTIANQFRSDLKEASIGDGQYAFQFTLPSQFHDALQHTLKATVNDKQTLAGSPVSIQLPRLPHETPETYLASIDTLEGGHVFGWCINTNKPQQPVALELYIDGEYICSMIADVTRPDLKEFEGSDGQIGFSHAIPAKYFDAQEHCITLFISDDRDFSSNNEALCRQTTLFERSKAISGHTTVDFDGMIQGWYVDYADIESPVKLDISVNNQKLTTITADQYRSDLGEFGNHSGQYSYQYLIPNHFFKGETVNIDITLHDKDERLFSNTLLCKDFYPYTFLDQDLKLEAQHLKKRLSSSPMFSILMPTYRSDLRYLKQAVQSVLNQSYSNWQLCIADDASNQLDLRKYLEKLMRKDKRIKVVFRTENGHISAASNSALALCQGEYTALLDHDDLLHPNALLHIAVSICENPTAGIIFSNEDKCDIKGNRYRPYFKKGFDHDLLMKHNLISHLGVYRTELLNQIGGFRKGYEGSQDYDLALRVLSTIKHDQVIHIPEVLYHWRAVAGSTAVNISEKNYAITAFNEAKKNYLNTLPIKP